MAETTGIAWTDATQNFWEGCTKVGPGCDFCYAEARDVRFHDGGHWGVGAPRRRMVEATFRRPLSWDTKRAQYEGVVRANRVWPGPVPPLWVFSLSLGDFFDNAVDPAWRADAWAIIKACRHLRWQLVTKRVGNVSKMLPEDWGDGSAYQHVGIIATTVTQEELLRDGPKLIDLKWFWGVKWVGLSCEPQLELLDLTQLQHPDALDWIITGGESKQGKLHAPRPYIITWADALIADCRRIGIRCFVKQLGDNPRIMRNGDDHEFTLRDGSRLADAGGNPAEWPANLRVREMPGVYDAEA